MKKLAVVLAAAFCLIAPAQASADAVWGDSQESITHVSGIDGPGSQSGAGFQTAQTITFSTWGQLAWLYLYLERDPRVAGDLIIEVRDVVNGAPGQNVLTSGYVPASRIPAAPSSGWTPVSFQKLINVWQGTKVAVVARASGNDHFGWYSAFPSSYARGEGLYSWNSPGWAPFGTGYDFAFKTVLHQPKNRYQN